LTAWRHFACLSTPSTCPLALRGARISQTNQVRAGGHDSWRFSVLLRSLYPPPFQIVAAKFVLRMRASRTQASARISTDPGLTGQPLMADNVVIGLIIEDAF